MRLSQRSSRDDMSAIFDRYISFLYRITPAQRSHAIRDRAPVSGVVSTVQVSVVDHAVKAAGLATSSGL